MFPIPFNFPFRKKDGSLTTIDDAITSGGGSYTLPTASDTTKGGIKVGTGLTMDGETLKNSNPTPYTLPAASDETLGGIKVGSGLNIDENGVLSASGGGGGGLSYIDLTLGEQVRLAANSFKNDYILTIGTGSPLIGKRIVNVLTPSASIFCAGVSSYQSNPIALNSQIRLLFYNASSAADGITELRIFYT